MSDTCGNGGRVLRAHDEQTTFSISGVVGGGDRRRAARSTSSIDVLFRRILLKLYAVKSQNRFLTYMVIVLATCLLLTACMNQKPSSQQPTPTPILKYPHLPVYPMAHLIKYEHKPYWRKRFVYRTDDEPKAVLNFYQSHLQTQGWSIRQAEPIQLQFSYSQGNSSSPGFDLIITITKVQDEGTYFEVQNQISGPFLWEEDLQKKP